MILKHQSLSNLLFIKFFSRRKSNLNTIKRINNSRNRVQIQALINQINLIELTIKDIIKEIFKAQLIKVRTSFSKKPYFFQANQQKYFEVKVNQSIYWHKKSLLNF